ncbi:sodium:solute symporter [Puteibacter caeruleilacunae]|nr:sodium:solute symporter [Puteibacter caeruleilacunae]
MKFLIKNIGLTLIIGILLMNFNVRSQPIEWEKITEIPGKSNVTHPGLAGCFAGYHEGVMIIAGGANFPKERPWNGGQKNWYDNIYVLHRLDNQEYHWTEAAEKLPNKLAYGVSVSTPKGVVCVGGNNQDQCFSNVFRLRFVADSGRVMRDLFPALPVPLSYMSGALLGNHLYIAGGQSSLKEGVPTKSFYRLDLSKEGTVAFQWEKLEPWPGEARAFNVMTAQNDGAVDCLFMFSGRNYGPGKETSILKDGYKYNPVIKKWTQLQGEFPVMAGGAFASGNEFIVFPYGARGDLFKKIEALELAVKESSNEKEKLDAKSKLVTCLEEHPGFPQEGLVYNTITRTLVSSGYLPEQGVATAPLVKHEDEVYIVSGEIRPGVRTPNILRGKYVDGANRFGWLNTLVLIIYFGILLFIGYYFSRRQQNTDDYFKGGGRVPWWAAGLSIFGTALSAITFMAIPAKAYATDWSYVWLNFAVLISAPLVVYYFIPLYRKMNITTAYEYLEKRFNLLLRLAGSASFILFQVGRMGVVLFLPAIALNVVTGIDIYVCILLMGLLSLLYTFMGGIEAVIWTDAMQVIVLLGGAILSLVLIIVNIDGGFAGIVTTAVEDNKFAALNMAFDFRQPTFWVVVLGGVFSQFATYGTDQTMVQRYLTTPDLKEAKNSLWTNIVLTVPATLLFFFVGTALYAFYKQNPASMNFNLANGDAIFPWFIVNELPDGVVGVLISGIFAAAMSSVSSSINSAATAYSSDFHFRLAGKGNEMKIARVSTVIIGLLGTIFALLMASWGIKSLWDVFNKVLGLIIGSMGGLFVLGVVFKNANSKGATIGFFGSLVLQILITTYTSLNLLLYTATGVIFCVIIGALSSVIVSDKK